MKMLYFKNALLIFGLLSIGLQTVVGRQKDHEKYNCGNHRISQTQKNEHMAKSFHGKSRFKKKQTGALKRADIKVLYASFQFKGEETPDVTNMEVVKKFFLDNSLGDFSITTTFAPVIELPYTRQEDLNDGDGAGDKDWVRDLVQLLTDRGFNPENYEYLIRRSHTGIPFMDFNGGVYYGGGLISVSGSYEGLIGHEMGHGIYIATGSRFRFLNHANLWKPLNTDQIVGQGTSEEYGNGYSVMGYSPLRHFGLPHKIEMQWLKSGDYHQVTANGTYKIYAHDHGNKQSGRKYGIRIGKKASPLGTSTPRDYYYVEFKNNFETFGSENIKNGVLLLTSDPDWGTHLFNTNRNTPNSYEQAALEVGKTFADNTAGITVKTLTKGGSGNASWMDVQITFDDPDGTEELPTVAFVTPNDRQVFSEGASVPIQINASQPGGTVKNVSVSIAGVGDPKTDTTAPYEFTWENLAAGNYEITATVTGNNNQTASKTISIQLGENIALVANAGPDFSLDCVNKKVTLGGTNTSTGEGITHQWATVDGNIVSGGNSTRVVVDKAGTYTLTVRKSGQSDATDQVVVASDTTAPSANAGVDVTIDQDESTQLNATGGNSYSWSPATGLSDANIANPNANPSVTTTYTLTATGANGCMATDEVVITVKEKELQIVNSFSPNGDGVNDTWKIEGIEKYSNATVTIYNRWGREVHEAVKNLEWDGNFKGTSLPVGAYYYVIQLDQTVKKGVINLIR